MKKLLAVVGAWMLLALPVMAQDQNAAPAAAPADTTAAPAKKAKMAGGDEDGIKKMFDDFAQAWNSGDVAGMTSFFTYDASLINPMGMEGQGLGGIKKVFKVEMAGPMKGTQQSYDDYKFVWVMNNMALVDTTATVTGMKKADGTDMGPMKVHVYGVIVNRGKTWKARSIRAYSFLPKPASSDASSDAAAPSADNAAPVADTAAPAADSAAPAKDTATPAAAQ